MLGAAGEQVAAAGRRHVMFQGRVAQTSIGSASSILEVIYHATVRNVRKSHGNALLGLAMNIVQTLIMVLVFYVMLTMFGARGSSIRGDFLLYLMSGVFLYMTHVKGLGAVTSSEGPASPMMQHAPMSTAISITSSALASLYLQILSAAAILGGYHVIIRPVEIAEPIGAFAMFLLAWLSGVSIGLCILAAKPWAPDFFGLIATIFQRANMIASGKMFVANTLPSHLLIWFMWNPLFHCIDQARGYAFINYNPHYTSVSYPVYFTLTFLVIGLMGEFFTRKHASASWNARR
jgi:ABC-type polysaccharide/polyol phosphate export permease